MTCALIGLGSNLGDRREHLERAVAAFDADAIRVVRRSTWYETSPIGGPPNQSPYLNGAIVVETSLEPVALWNRLSEAERREGRMRDVAWGPRTLDLDLLLYDDRVIELPQLVVPHPRLAFRKFALQGAAEVAPDWMHPVLKRSPAALLRHLQTAPNHVAAIGASDAFRSQFMAEAAHYAGAGLTESTGEGIAAHAADLVCRDGLTAADALEFLAARRSAIAQTSAVAPGWTFDDAWPAAEFVTLAERLADAERERLRLAAAAYFASDPPPKLLVCLRTAGEPRWGAIEQWRRRAVAAGFSPEFPPTVDAVVADREGAFAEIAAAMAAAS